MELVPFRIESFGKTHQGCVRSQNQDSLCTREESGLWAVADGMGGHEGGEWASARLVEKLDAVDLPADFEAACAALAEAIRAANAVILTEARRRERQMGSTIVLLLVQGQRYAIVWVGDSRAYRLRNGTLEQLSRDHSQVQEMVDRGLLSAEDAINHPMGHILSRAVGVRDEVQIDTVTGEVQPGDVFLLCSDGLHGYVEEKDIARLLARATPERASEALVDLTLANGAPDNVTVVAVWASEPTMLSLSDR
ncbi:PP2C family protein-serine/threonine phosphatase [Sphingosinicella terrae]|uniref:PP2C family protein-serine/threonine phosphatase n=1 Tax=Sphingosinicella terrae TaxID=2172047 RepID=UPI000E0CD67E|nr:protein phosphatase 2C domain-containing protein [Sphingosinicella terrae]